MTPAPPTHADRLVDRLATRMLGLPAARTAYLRGRERIPMRDGAVLLAEHYVPQTAHPMGTVLIRTPYGRRTPLDVLSSRTLAARGYHVLVQSVRGTFGSGGEFDPMVAEARDGQDTVAWLREQGWFDGRLATSGGSYLGWTQWTLMTDPPPELKAAVVLVGPHDFAASVYGTGAFALHAFLSWSDMVVRQEEGGLPRRLADGVTAARRLAPVFRALPLVPAAERMLGHRAPWFRGWVAHDDLGDPFWEPRRAGAGLACGVPTLLIGGWQDLFVEQTVAQYAALRAHGTDVALTVGPWMHIDVGGRAARTVARESLDWLDEHLAGVPRRRGAPVRVHVTGARAWRELAHWPPSTAPHVRHLGPAGGLDEQPPRTDEPLATFRYDPADPTPSVGGRLLTPAAGMRDNRELARRADVVTFTTEPLATALEVHGAPVVELQHAADPPYADVFVRLCDVSDSGESLNFSDGMRRLRPGPEGRVRIELDPCAHRLDAGHRLQLLVAGGAHPRFQRNNGTGEPHADATGLVAVDHTVRGGRVTLPVAP